MVNDRYDQAWFVYIAQCKDSSLYVGIALNVERRIHEHNNTQRCRYTRFRKPVTLLYKEPCKDYSSARKREKEIKRFSRNKKLSLISKDLSPVIS